MKYFVNVCHSLSRLYTKFMDNPRASINAFLIFEWLNSNCNRILKVCDIEDCFYQIIHLMEFFVLLKKEPIHNKFHTFGRFLPISCQIYPFSWHIRSKTIKEWSPNANYIVLIYSWMCQAITWSVPVIQNPWGTTLTLLVKMSIHHGILLLIAQDTTYHLIERLRMFNTLRYEGWTGVFQKVTIHREYVLLPPSDAIRYKCIKITFLNTMKWSYKGSYQSLK